MTMSKMHSASLLSTPWPFWTEKVALLKIPGAPLSKRSAPVFLSRYHRRFLAHFIYEAYLKNLVRLW